MENLKRILLAEDNENDIELTISALEEFNLANQVDIVNDGVQAMDYMHCRNQYKDRTSGDPILIILDIKMPKMDGLEVLKYLKQNIQFKNIPIVMLTSSYLDQDVIESYSAGVNAYVVKPIDFVELIDAVKKLGLYWAIL